MRACLPGAVKRLGVFLLIAALVAGGLGWVTVAALDLERDQHDHRASAEQAGNVRLALWRLDSRIAALLTREDSRPFNHYSAVFAPPLALDTRQNAWRPGALVEPSPLLDTDLPPWMLLHFQATTEAGWESPQVLSPTLSARLRKGPAGLGLGNITAGRRRLLEEMGRELPAGDLLGHARKHGARTTVRDRTLLMACATLERAAQAPNQPYGVPAQDVQSSVEYLSRRGMNSNLVYQSKNNPQRTSKTLAVLNFERNGENWLGLLPSKDNNPAALPMEPLAELPAGAEVAVSMSPMVGLWLPTRSGSERLVALRLVRIEAKEICQGIVLDGAQLTELLAAEVQDLLPAARVVPVHPGKAARPDRAMTALPLQLDTDDVPLPATPHLWTPLRFGLCLAWTAALVALLAVGLGGWSLISLSQRRIRFVSAVTHELRTPLTTLRLYLDMLTSGLVRQESQRAEYLQTLNDETERLNRLVGNVLDFARLENDRHPRPALTPVSVAEVLKTTQQTWQGRCTSAGKDLVVEDAPDAVLSTDLALLQQVLGNLIDNACKYTREAADRRLWLRAKAEACRVVFEVEDRGPGVSAGERRSIFRAFRRGRCADVTAGGVGLGLALARQWAQLLGGRLGPPVCPAEGGACFRVELPAK
jgi:signal transduction histidine kinase